VGWPAIVIVVAVLAVVLVGLPVLAARVRRGGTGGSVMGPFEDMWHPAGRRARDEIEIQQEVPAPEPAPGDKLF
jgi:hypothetical protein